MPSGFFLESQKAPLPRDLNRLLSKCNEETHPPKKLALALEKSCFYLSIFEESSGKLAGFVRATSDRGLNANLWNLVAEPGDNQQDLLKVLVYNALKVLRRDMPGCSISVQAPVSSFISLEESGFILDPNGIRVMGYKL